MRELDGFEAELRSWIARAQASSAQRRGSEDRRSAALTTYTQWRDVLSGHRHLTGMGNVLHVLETWDVQTDVTQEIVQSMVEYILSQETASTQRSA